ncbi:MAG: LysR family transcriptional regulator [Rubrivivax sp.]
MDTHRNLNLQLLAYLEALVAERHVTRAADRMGIGQPAMSSALARLRLVFKDPILVKTRAGMEPTGQALQLAAKFHEAMALIDQATRAAQPFEPRAAERHFRLMASDGVAQLFLPPLLARMRSQGPGLRFTCQPGDMRRSAEFLREGECDLVIGHLPRAAAELHTSQLYPQQAVCIAARAHPCVQGSLTLDQFVAMSHVVFGGGPVPFPSMETMVDERLAELGLSRRAALRVPSLTLTAPVVAATDLLAIVPQRVAQAGAEMFGLQILAVPLALDVIDIGMYWHGRLHRDPAHSFLRSVMREVAAELRGAGCLPPVH